MAQNCGRNQRRFGLRLNLVGWLPKFGNFDRRSQQESEFRSRLHGKGWPIQGANINTIYEKEIDVTIWQDKISISNSSELFTPVVGETFDEIGDEVRLYKPLSAGLISGRKDEHPENQ